MRRSPDFDSTDTGDDVGCRYSIALRELRRHDVSNDDDAVVERDEDEATPSDAFLKIIVASPPKEQGSIISTVFAVAYPGSVWSDG